MSEASKNFGYITLDILLAPISAVISLPFKIIRHYHLSKLPITHHVLRKFGIFPIKNHYYEPLYDFKNLTQNDVKRNLPALDLDLQTQKVLLHSFRTITAQDFKSDVTASAFQLHKNFGPGDAELWFQIIRQFKPKRIVEIGSGHSTRVAVQAVAKNKIASPEYNCNHICIEPYEMPWLEETGVKVIRDRVENVDMAIFDELQENDVLFIDSSHMIRPQGDVLFEFLEIIPRLAKGVIVHVHDIFTPRDYPVSWITEPKFWNEQYLLEAFLSNNSAWRVLLAANFLKHECYRELHEKCVWLVEESEPGSFYMQRI